MTPDPRGGRQSRRRPRRLWQVFAGLAILVLAVFAWQQGGDGEGGGPPNAIAQAAARTQGEPGGRTEMRGVLTSSVPSESFTMTGEGTYDVEAGRSQAAMTMPDVESVGRVEMDLVSDGTMIYMRSSMLGSLPDDREWMALDLTLGEDLDMPVPTEGDPEGELALLEAVTGEVRKLGKEDVRGVPTTRYWGTVGVAENAERLREEGAEGLAGVVEEENVSLEVEAWIDAEGLVRRMRLVKSEPREEGKGSVTLDMRTEFFDFGPVPEIEVPGSDDVFDATALVQEEFDIAGDG